MESMNAILDASTEKVFHCVAATFMEGGGNKKAKDNVKEHLRQVYLSGSFAERIQISKDLVHLADEIRHGK